MARRRSGQDPQSDRANTRAAAGLQKRNASAAVSGAGFAAPGQKVSLSRSLFSVEQQTEILTGFMEVLALQENPPRQHPAVHGLHDQAQLCHHHAVV